MRLFVILVFGVTFIELVLCYIDTQNNNFLIKRNTEEEKRYKPDWEDLDKRPLPQWYDQAKIGIFLHWGVFSVPSFSSEWFWKNWQDPHGKVALFMSKNYPPNFTYQDFAPMFKAEFFDPNKFADLFKKAGAKYVVLTSKHHEGFTLFPSKRSFSWNSVDVGPHRDLVKDLGEAVKDALVFTIHCMNEQTYADTKLWPDIKQLITDYQPSVLWSDGDWEAKDTYWKSCDLLAWLYNDSPVKNEIVVNDRWGIGIPCKHGDFYNCADRYNPGRLQNHKWENAFTLDKKSWGYRRNMEVSDVLTMKELLNHIISTVSCGGNALINVGPTKEGTIAPIFEERLLDLGKWLKVNGEGIYGSSPWSTQNDTFNGNIWYTCVKTQYDAMNPTAIPSESDTVTAVYAFFLDWPETNTLILANATSLVQDYWRIQMLGYKGNYLDYKLLPNDRVAITLPGLEHVKSENAWTLKFVPPYSVSVVL
ncbi:hypothetical protein ABMA27_013869 [Loxostege sticticalis]|uniref:alpha-L-fucosidase n=1 Tax=Loxostege sticticalis TaxID=481309 RepID=A0ABR3IBV9_LOXSC